MKNFKIGDNVQMNDMRNVVNIHSGVVSQVAVDEKGVVFNINNGKQSGVIQYLVNFPNVMDVDFGDPVIAWVPGIWLKDKVLHDRYGHEVYWVPLDKAVGIIIDSFKSGKVRAIMTGNYCKDPTDIDTVEEWCEIVAPDILSTFNHGDDGIFLMMGGIGGGYVTGAYIDSDESYEDCSRQEVREMLERVTGLTGNNNIFLQLIDKNYPGNENELW